MRHALGLLALLTLVAAPAAIAQDVPPSDSTDYERYRDAARSLQVLTVRLDGGRYVYDLRGGDEDEAVLWTNGSAFVVHGIEAGHVMVVVEPDDGIAGTVVPDAVFLSAAQQAQQIRPADYAFDHLEAGQVAFYRVRVLRCADEGADVPRPPAGACQAWEPVLPLSGGEGLRLVIVPGPELGVGGGGGQRPDDD